MEWIYLRKITKCFLLTKYPLICLIFLSSILFVFGIVKRLIIYLRILSMLPGNNLMDLEFDSQPKFSVLSIRSLLDFV